VDLFTGCFCGVLGLCRVGLLFRPKGSRELMNLRRLGGKPFPIHPRNTTRAIDSYSALFRFLVFLSRGRRCRILFFNKKLFH